MALNDIWNFAPKTWDRLYEADIIALSPGSEEYKSVQNDLEKAVDGLRKILSIKRAQNIYDFGQFLMRGQILCTENPGIQYYEVRRYVEIPSIYKDTAFKHNLDHRRMDLDELVFKSHLRRSGSNTSTIFVVKILTNDQKARHIKPYNFTEYYIDYIVEIV